MSILITCPVCKSELRIITLHHIKSKKHQDALIKAGIDPSKDPALELLIKLPKPTEHKAEKTRIVPKIGKGPKIVAMPEPSKLQEPIEQQESTKIKEKIEVVPKEEKDLNIVAIPEPPKLPKPLEKQEPTKKANKIELKLLPLSIKPLEKQEKIEAKKTIPEGLEYASKQDLELEIPTVPEPPKKK